MRRIFPLMWVMCMLAPGGAFSQPDTTRISIQEAERQFLRNNLQLLAARFNVDAAEAAVTQAKLWTNPNIQIEQNVYNQFTRRTFDFTKDGNTEVQLQQLFLLAGKRDKQIRLAEINARRAEHTLYDLLRAIRLELRSDIYDLYFLQRSISFYDESSRVIRNTVASVERIYEKRSILLAEVLRLKALLFSLDNERLGLMNQIADIEGDLHILLRDSSRVAVYYVPVIRPDGLDSMEVDSLGLGRLIALAKELRPDYKIADANVRFEETNLSLQRAMAVPDVTLGGRWSRAGSYIPEYFAVTVAVDLPLFNRNQGNIQVSEKTLEANRALRENAERTVEKEVTVSFQKALQTDRLYRTFDRKFPGEYRTLVEGMVQNYLKRNMTIIEFTDFYESYRTAMLQINQLQDDRADAFEALNYATGSDLYGQPQ
jgi:cobalt-zinc-cadmium efflux system outer membrane protein